MTDRSAHISAAPDTAIIDLWDRVEAIQASGSKLCLAVTGGGSRALTWLLNHPGASRAVLDAHIPYCSASLEQYLSQEGPLPVSDETARLMARRAYVSSLELHPEGTSQIGLSCTAALATNRHRRGEDRAWIAVRTRERYFFHGLCFERRASQTDEEARYEQEDTLSTCLISALAEACGLQVPDPPPQSHMTLTKVEWMVDPALEDLFTGAVDVVEMGTDGHLSASVARHSRLILSGSFNPLHDGHVELAAVAERRTGRSACLEISIHNVDKPTLAYCELRERLVPLKGRFPVLLTRAPTFDQKAALFADACFVIGYDTAVRLVDPAYYGGEAADGEADMDRALGLLGQRGSRFLVAGRNDRGHFKTLEDVPVPPRHAHLLEAIPEAEFRRDLSSSQLREKASPEP